MADMGADVIKVEALDGDSMRGMLRQAIQPQAPRIDHPFQQTNRGKRSLAIDLRSAEGQAVVHRLLKDVDVMTTNLLPDRLARFGLDEATVRSHNDQVILAEVSALGRSGPEADRTGFDMTAFFARGGAMSAMASPESGPARFRPGQGDHMTSMNLLAAVLAALRVRDQTGEGQTVDVSLLGTSVWAMGSDLAATMVDHQTPEEISRSAPPNPLINVYRCRDGRWINIVLAFPASWIAICEAVGRPEWIEDARFATIEDRVENSGQLVAELDRVFAERSMPEWAALFDAHGITWEKVASLGEVVDDSQLRRNNAFAKIEHPDGTFETLSTPFNIQGADVDVRGPAPEIGADTVAVLEEAGFSVGEIDTLLGSGTITNGAS